MTPNNAPSDTDARISYQDHLHIWLTALRLGIVGKISTSPIIYDLIVDIGTAVTELRTHCDIPVSEALVRRTLQTFRLTSPPYSSFAPTPALKSAMAAAKSRKKNAGLSAFEINKLGAHIRGLMSR